MVHTQIKYHTRQKKIYIPIYNQKYDMMAKILLAEYVQNDFQFDLSNSSAIQKHKVNIHKTKGTLVGLFTTPE